MADDRKTAALLGAFVADAASMPLHWIYDQAALRALVGDNPDPLFFSPPSCPYYNSRSPTEEGNEAKGFPGHYELGSLSPTGEQALALLQFLRGRENAAAAIDGDEWAVALHAWSKAYTGRRDHALQLFVANMEAGKKYPETGADDNQAQSFGKVPSVLYTHVAGDGGDDDEALYLANVDVCVRAHQNNDLNAAAALFWARLLRRVAVGGDTVQAAYEAAKAAATHEPLLAALLRVEANIGNETFPMLMAYGKELHEQSGGKVPPIAGLSCNNPGATMAALHVVLRAESFAQGLATNVLLGGDSCARSTIIGAVLGAAFGVPQEHLAKLRVPELAELYSPAAAAASSNDGDGAGGGGASDADAGL
jgi:ADP-ribosylglycohydrolase